MSNNQDWEDDFDFDFEDEEAPQRTVDNGNDLVKKLRKAERAKEKQIRELEARLAELTNAQRKNVVESFLANKGLNPKVAKFIPSDIDPTESALNQWVDEYGDVFGLASSEQSQAPDLATLRQIDAVTSGAVTPDKIENILLRLDQASSQDEIIRMIQSGEY